MNTVFKILLAFMLMVTPAWGGVDLDGTDDIITHSYDIGDVGSMAHWLKMDGTAGPYIFDYYSNGTAGNYNGFTDATSITEIHTGVLSSAYTFTYQDGTSANSISLSGGTTSLNPVCIVATWNESGSAILYVDGVSVASATLSTKTFVDNAVTVNKFGEAGNGDRNYDGKVFEKVLWNVQLTANEVSQYCNSKSKRMAYQIRPSALVQYWSMDVHNSGVLLDGQTIKDFSSGGNNGTASDGANNTGMTATGEEVLSYPSNF